MTYGFPSPYGVSFILILSSISSPSSPSIWFPSPYGVLFILMSSHAKFIINDYIPEFPSPYGVLFILIIW